MTWADSRVFTQAVLNPLTESAQGTTNKALPTGYSTTGGILTDVIKTALYNNSVTPDKDAALASTAFGTGTWSGNEVTGTNWATGGQTLGSKTYALSTGSVAFDAADVSVATATISGAFGCMCYDSSISAPTASQGLCFNFFGGSQSVTAGTFTIQWNAAGVFNFAT